MSLFTKKQAAEELSISVATLDRIIQRGDLVAHKVGGSIRIKESSISEYLDNQKVIPKHEVVMMNSIRF